MEKIRLSKLHLLRAKVLSPSQLRDVTGGDDGYSGKWGECYDENGSNTGYCCKTDEYCQAVLGTTKAYCSDVTYWAAGC